MMTNEMSEQQQYEREIVRSYEDEAEYASSHGRQDESEVARDVNDATFLQVYYAAKGAGFTATRDTYPADDGTEVEVVRIEGTNNFGVMVEFKDDVVIVHADMMWEVHHGNLEQLQTLYYVVGPGALVIHCFDVSHLVHQLNGESWGKMTGATLRERVTKDDDYYDSAFVHNWDYE